MKGYALTGLSITRGTKMRKDGETVFVSFDMRSEKYDHVRAPETLLKELSNPTHEYRIELW